MKKLSTTTDFSLPISNFKGFHGGSDGKKSACNVGDLGPIPGSGRSSGERNGHPVQHSCLENSNDRRAWGAKIQILACNQESP